MSPKCIPESFWLFFAINLLIYGCGYQSNPSYSTHDQLWNNSIPLQLTIGLIQKPQSCIKTCGFSRWQSFSSICRFDWWFTFLCFCSFWFQRHTSRWLCELHLGTFSGYSTHDVQYERQLTKCSTSSRCIPFVWRLSWHCCCRFCFFDFRFHIFFAYWRWNLLIFCFCYDHDQKLNFVNRNKLGFGALPLRRTPSSILIDLLIYNWFVYSFNVILHKWTQNIILSSLRPTAIIVRRDSLYCLA